MTEAWGVDPRTVVLQYPPVLPSPPQAHTVSTSRGHLLLLQLDLSRLFFLSLWLLSLFPLAHLPFC